jgi:predicted metal-dependent peptidase
MAKKNKNPVAPMDKAIEEAQAKLDRAKELSKSGNLNDALSKFDMNDHIISLLDTEPFFAAISRHVEKRADLSIPTAGVRVSGEGHYEMIYNPYFFAEFDAKIRLGVLKHEFYHLILEHVSARLPDADDGSGKKMNRMWNVATDLSINTHIPDEIPAFGCIPGVGPFADMPPMKTAEWYYAELKKKQKENGEGEGDEFGDSFDDHEGWGEGDIDPSVKEIAKQRLKEMMKEAAEEANKKNWGSVSSDMRADIMDRISNKVNWRNVLRYFIKTSQRADKQNTVKRLNKRFPYIHAGRKVERRANIAISIDQSGSVSDEMLTKFFAELNGLAKLATFTVIPFDCEVDEKLIYVWKKGKHQKAKRVKFGGTDFDKPTEYVNKHPEFDGHIILTDMYAPKPKPSRCPRMWMTDKHGANSPYFQTTERVVSVD